MDLDKWIEKLKGGEYLAEDELKALCDFVSGPAGRRSIPPPPVPRAWACTQGLGCPPRPRPPGAAAS